MLPRVLEEGQRIMKLGVDLHVYIMSNDSNAWRPNHPAKNSACASVESPSVVQIQVSNFGIR